MIRYCSNVSQTTQSRQPVTPVESDPTTSVKPNQLSGHPQCADQTLMQINHRVGGGPPHSACDDFLLACKLQRVCLR